MRWSYYFKVLVSGTLLNLYYYTGLFDKTGSALQAKYLSSRKMGTTSLGERLDKTFRALDNSLHRDNSIGIRRRPDGGGREYRQPSSLRLNITHGDADSDAGSRIKNHTAYEREAPHTHRAYPSHTYSRIYINQYVGECVLAFGHTTVSLLSRLLALQVT